jgi:hypothetical protein
MKSNLFRVTLGLLVIGTLQITPISLAGQVIPDQRLSVRLEIYGLNNITGQILGIVTTRNLSGYRIIDSAELDSSDNRTDGVGFMWVPTQNATLTAGSEYKVCLLIIKDASMFCQTNIKSGSLRNEYVTLKIRHRIE